LTFKGQKKLLPLSLSSGKTGV